MKIEKFEFNFFQCPFFNVENIIRFDGYWLTMTRKGSMIVPKERFPEGFFIVLVVHKNDDECETKSLKNLHNSNTPSILLSSDKNNNEKSKRTKSVIVKITNTVKKEHVIVELIWPFSMLIGLAILTSLVLYFTSYKETEGDEQNDEETARNRVELLSIPNNVEEGEQNGIELVTLQDMQQEETTPEQNSSSSNRCKNIVTLNQLAGKKSKNRDKNSSMFLLFVMPIAIYYCLPAIQLVFFYLFTSHKTGNLDLCYYNFRCAYPYWFFNDFNHVWSNICYVFVGVFGFVFVHFHKQKYLNKKTHKVGYGIPPQFGLSNALAFSILIEGLLSASYHVCPNRSNFHHDTCFMYVAVTLSALRLYHSRHPDTALGATKAFAILGIVIITDLLGEMLEYLWYFLLFSLLHFATLVILATELYFLGRRSVFSPSIFGSIWDVLKTNREGHSETTPVASSDLYWLIISGFVANLGIFLGLGLVPFLDETKPVFDFGTYLLIILGGNTVIYLIYYLIMKVIKYFKKYTCLEIVYFYVCFLNFQMIHREGLSGLTMLLLIISTAFWISGGIFFGMTRTSWEESPANSRVKNEDCDTYFYDTHDLWHILSSGALYTTLMVFSRF